VLVAVAAVVVLVAGAVFCVSLATGFSLVVLVAGCSFLISSFLDSSFLGSSFGSPVAFFFSSAFFFLCSKYFPINLLKSFPDVAALWNACRKKFVFSGSSPFTI
jgi:hypothetical protein